MTPEGTPVDPEVCWTCGHFQGQQTQLLQIGEPKPKAHWLSDLITVLIECAAYETGSKKLYMLDLWAQFWEQAELVYDGREDWDTW
jgi:hypothetical protein